MAKTVKGYRNPSKYDYKGDDVMRKIIEHLSSSDDGWLCPHCGCKSDPHNEELTTESWFQLMEEMANLEVICGDCDKKYFVNAFTTHRFNTCVDETFGDEESTTSG